MKKVYLLGANNKHELIFTKIELRHPLKYDSKKLIYCEDKDSVQFSVCFCAVDFLTASESIDEIKEEYCDLYLYSMVLNNNSWAFKWCHGGQYDSRAEGMDEYVNKEAYDLLHELWDKYHLKNVEQDTLRQIGSFARMMSKNDEEEWILDYIERHKEEL